MVARVISNKRPLLPPPLYL